MCNLFFSIGICYIHVCVFVLYVYTFACVHGGCMHAYVCLCTYVYVHVCMYVCMYVITLYRYDMHAKAHGHYMHKFIRVLYMCIMIVN